MAAFFAMSWNPRHEASAARARKIGLRIDACCPKLAPPLRIEGFELHHLDPRRNDASILALTNRSAEVCGAVFGTVFSREDGSAAPLAHIPPGAAERIAVSRGDHLLTGYWGSYVAFLPHRPGLTLLCDPASSIPCFHTAEGGLTLCFSNLELCSFLDRSRYRVNLGHVRALLAYDKIQNGASGLEGIHELGAGQRVTLTPEKMLHAQAWDPRRFAADPIEPDPASATRLVTGAIDRAVSSWAAASARVLLNLSGGLDSAVIAASLARIDGNVPVSAVHIRLDSADPPEAHHARAVADHLGLRLDELVLSPETPLPCPGSHPPSARPYREFVGGGAVMASAALPGSESSTLLTGQGGDHLFQQVRTPLGFADYLKLHGLSPGAGRALIDAARLSRQSVWSVLGATFPHLLPGPHESPMLAGIRARMTPLGRRAHDGLDLAGLLPVWAGESAGLPPAKAGQVGSLIHMTQIRTGLAVPGSLPARHPLISQPVMELCLRLPVHLLCMNGQPRGLLRHAMEERLPEAVRLRRSKGDASRFYMAQIAANRTIIADALLDGELVSHGLLDRRDVEAFLTGDAYRRHVFGRMVFVFYTVESWLRAWRNL